MAKEFKKWIDEFVEHGANPKNVVNWPEEAGGGGGTKVVNELPEVGEEYIIYELQEKKKIPSLIPRVNQQMINDGVFSELLLFVFVFDTSEDMTSTLTPIIPEEENPFYMNYIIKEDKLIVSIYGGTEWQFGEVTKVSDYKFDLSSVFGGGSSTYLVMLKEYLGKSSEEGEDVKYAGKLLNDELYTFEPNTFCVLLGAPTNGIMVFNHRYEAMQVEVPEEYTFEYIPYEKIINNQLMEVTEGMNVLWAFKSNGTSEGIVSSYWIYANKKWFNADEIKPIKLQDKIVNPTTSAQEITYDNGYNGLSKVSVNAVTNNIDANIVASNIKKGIKILDITGTYEGDGAIYNISALTEILPKGVELAGVAQVGSNIYVFGGYLGGKAIYKLNSETDTLITLSTTLPQELYGMGVGSVGSDIYLFGGSNGSYVNTIYKFNAETETITTLSTKLPKILCGMGVASIGSNIYIFGGNSSSYSNTIYKFNTKTETITTLSTTLPQKLFNMGVASIGNIVYIFGGYFANSNMSTIYKFDISTETITTLSTRLPQELRNMGVAVVGSNIYLFGGFSTSRQKTIYKFNTETETLTTLITTLPEILESMGVANVGSNVYLFGGTSTSLAINTIYKFKIDF